MWNNSQILHTKTWKPSDCPNSTDRSTDWQPLRIIDWVDGQAELFIQNVKDSDCRNSTDVRVTDSEAVTSNWFGGRLSQTLHTKLESQATVATSPTVAQTDSRYELLTGWTVKPNSLHRNASDCGTHVHHTHTHRHQRILPHSDPLPRNSAGDLPQRKQSLKPT